MPFVKVLESNDTRFLSMPPFGVAGDCWRSSFGGEKRSDRRLLLMTNFFMLPVLPYCLELGLAENAPGARMLSSALKLRRRLLVEMLLPRDLPILLPRRLPLKVAPGVLAELETLFGVP